MDIGVHMLDAAVWLTGNTEVLSVKGNASCHHASEIGDLAASGALTGHVDRARTFDPAEMDVEDFAAGHVTFKNGAVMNFKVAWAANLPEEASIKLVGADVGITLPEKRLYRGMDQTEMLEPTAAPYPDHPFIGHFYLVDNLRQAVYGKASPAVKPQETIAVAQIMEAFYRSAQLGREVLVSDLP